MNNRTYNGLLGLLMGMLLISQSAHAAGAAAGRLLVELMTTPQVVAGTMNVGDSAASELVGNLNIVRQLVGASGDNPQAGVTSFADNISSQVVEADRAEYDEMVRLMGLQRYTPEDSKKLHDLLVYFSYRYTTSRRNVMLYCIMCNSGTELANNGFKYTFKNTSNTPFSNIITDINSKSLAEVNADIERIMKASGRRGMGFPNFSFSANPSLLSGQEHAFLLFLRVTTTSRASEELAPFKEYGRAVRELAQQVSGDSGQFFGADNPNRFHMVFQELLDSFQNTQANSTPQQVINTWTTVLNDTKALLQEDGANHTLASAIEKVMKDNALLKETNSALEK